MKTQLYLPIILIAFCMGLTGNQVSAQTYASIKTAGSIRSDSAYQLPFYEDWESHSLSTNQWQTSDDAWDIDIYTGNEGASVKFSGASYLTNYVSRLTSRLLKGDTLFVGTVTLNFDLKLNDLNNTGTEYLYIKIFNGTDYITIDSVNNTGSFDWEQHSYDISQQVFGNDFKLVFEAAGERSSRLLGWYVDNIEIFRTCDPPLNLIGEMGMDTSIYGMISWDTPPSVLPITEWEHWDSGQNSSQFGITGEGTYSVAIRWDAGMLDNVDGSTIKKVKFYLSHADFDYMVVKIWTGANASNLIYSDTLTNPATGTWTEVEITDTVITVDATQEYWVGYQMINTFPNAENAGVDAGPAVSGYGDMIKLPGSDWAALSQYSINYNWNIEMYVESAATQDPANLLQFNVYRKTNWETEYSLLSTVPFTGYSEGVYYDYTIEPLGIWYAYYKVNAVWGKSGDTCISDYAINADIPEQDFVIIDFTESVNELHTDNYLNLFPNPAVNSFNIVSKSAVTRLVIYNLNGIKMLAQSLPGEKEITINVSSLPKGLYFAKIETNKGAVIKKLMVQ